MTLYTREDILLQNDKDKEWIPVKFELENGLLTLYKQNKFLFELSKTMLGYDSRIVILDKQGGPLGLAIQGGIEYNRLVQITKIEDNTPASRSPEVHTGDTIVSINNEPIFNKTHDDAIQIFKSSIDYVKLHLITVKNRSHREAENGGFSLLDITPEEGQWLLMKEIQLAAASLSQYDIRQNRKLTSSFILKSFPSKTFKFHCQLRLEKCLEETSKNIIAANKKKAKELNADYSLQDLVCMGWINECLSSSKYSKVWTDKFLVLRKEEIEIYSQYPTNLTDWQSPELSYGVCDITWKTLTDTSMQELQTHTAEVYRPHSLYLQSATGGKHIIAFDTQAALQYWEQEMNNEIFDVVKKINARTFTAKWKRDAVDFTIDLKRGFLIQDTSSEEILWSKPFAHLRSSTDDGGNKLYLKFQDGDQTIEVTELHSVLCTIEAFLKTAVHVKENRPDRL